MIWPLIFACSIKVRNNDAIFKPEYIIPQLLLQWVRSNGDIDGIRYWSTLVKQLPKRFKGEYFNLVLPIKESKDEGLCSELCRKFESTEIISWQTYQLSLGGTYPIMPLDSNIKDKIDLKMDYLELIKGMKNPYSSSVFGKMEMYLSEMTTKNINGLT